MSNINNDPIYLIFDRAPGPDGAVFIEAETTDGKSVNAGEWKNRDDGLVQFGPFYRAAPEHLPVQEQQDERAAFEAWHGGVYRGHAYDIAFAAWQARAVLTPPVSAPVNEALRAALQDMLSGWRYIRDSHGDLYGVGWDRAQNAAEAALAGVVLAPIAAQEMALNVSHPDCHAAADAFWAYWSENGLTHKRGYYESTWGAINRAIRTVGVVPHNYGEPLPATAPQFSAVPVAAEVNSMFDEITDLRAENARLSAGWHAANVDAAVQAQGDERSMFEDYAKGKGFRLDRKDDGEYVYLETADRWKIWQATFYAASAYGFDKGQRAVLQSPPVSEVATISGKLQQALQELFDADDQDDHGEGNRATTRFNSAMNSLRALSQPPAVEAPSELMNLFREALAWGKVYGGVMAEPLWSEMREKMVKQFAERTALPAPLPKAEAASDEPAAFERAMNDARFFPAELSFARTKSPSGRDEYANAHLQSCWVGWQARAALAPSTAQPSKYGSPELQALIVAKAMEGVQPAQGTQAVPEGFVLAPIEPTPMMMAKAVAQRGSYSTDQCFEAAVTYRLMLAAAPKPPAVRDGEPT